MTVPVVRRGPLMALLAAVFFPYLYLFPHLDAANNPNENVRLYMTKAVVDHGTLVIGYREPADPRGRNFRDVGSVHGEYGYVNDRALVCADANLKPPNCRGTLYAAKAPGTSFLGVPVYAAAKQVAQWLGQHPSKVTWLFWLRLFCVIGPVLALLIAFERMLRRPLPDLHLRSVLVVGLGLASTVYGYGAMFAGHSLAAAALFGGFLMLYSIEPQPPVHWRSLLSAALAGFLTGYAVITEYPSLIGAVLIAGYLMRRHGWQLWLAFAVGALPPAVLGGLFHQIAFGAFYRTPYVTLENAGFVHDIAPGFMGIQAPKAEALAGSLAAPFNGLFFFSPWSALIVPALVSLAWWRRPSVARIGALVALALATVAASLATPWGLLGIPLVAATYFGLLRPAARPAPEGSGLAALVFLGYVVFVSCHSLWRGGWTVGPRYVVMAAPFTALAIALCVPRWSQVAPFATRVLLAGTVAASLVITQGTGLVTQGYPFEYYNPFYEMAVPLWRDGYVFASAGSWLGLRGHLSLLPYYVVIGGLLLWLVFGGHRNVWQRLTGGLAAAALALGVLTLLALPQRPWTAGKAEMLRWHHRGWQPADQAEPVRRLAVLEALKRLPSGLSSAAERELASLYTRMHRLSDARRTAEQTADRARGIQKTKPPKSLPPIPTHRSHRPADR